MWCDCWACEYGDEWRTVMRDDVRSVERCQIMKALFIWLIDQGFIIIILGSRSMIFSKIHEDNLLCQ